MNVSYKRLRPSDWPAFQDDILDLENRLFGGTLLSGKDSFPGWFTDPGVVAYVAQAGGVFAGFIIGLPSEDTVDHFVDDETGGLLYHFDEIGPNTLYIWAIEVEPGLNGRGIGTVLKKTLVDEARNLGYSSVSGHARVSTGSAYVTDKLAPAVRKLCSNYFDTGEDYMFYRIDLK